MPKIEILLATYQGQAFLRAQLDSLFAQSYPHLAILVRDDCSTDATVDLLNSYARIYPQQLKILVSQQRLGVVNNYSTLLQAAQAPYIAFSDQDDLWFKDKLFLSYEKMCAAEKQYGVETPLLVHTDLQVVDQNLQLIHPSYWRYTGLKPTKASTFNRLLVQNTVTGCTMLINSALKNRIARIPSEAIMHDGWCALVAAAFGQIISLENPTLLYRQHLKNSIGAKPFNLANYLKKAWLQLAKPQLAAEKRQQRLRQAQMFYELYYNDLKASDKQILSAFLSTANASFFKKKYYFIRYKLIRNGYLRNASCFLLNNPF